MICKPASVCHERLMFEDLTNDIIKNLPFLFISNYIHSIRDFRKRSSTFSTIYKIVQGNF